MNRLDEHLAEVIKIAPLATAEDFTGQRVEDGGIGFAAGLAMVHGKASTMKRLLRGRGDVWDGMPLSEYRAAVEAYGFEIALELPFAHTDPWGKQSTETLFVYAHRDGLLLKFDTYDASRVNSGNVYYCWRRADGADDGWMLSSGRYLAPDYTVWTGDHDAREALLFNLDRLRANGSFVSPWPEKPFLWLLHYEDSKVDGYDYNAINTEREKMLPAWVLEFMGGVHG